MKTVMQIKQKVETGKFPSLQDLLMLTYYSSWEQGWGFLLIPHVT